MISFTSSMTTPLLFYLSSCGFLNKQNILIFLNFVMIGIFVQVSLAICNMFVNYVCVKILEHPQENGFLCIDHEIM